MVALPLSPAPLHDEDHSSSATVTGVFRADYRWIDLRFRQLGGEVLTATGVPVSQLLDEDHHHQDCSLPFDAILVDDIVQAAGSVLSSRPPTQLVQLFRPPKTVATASAISSTTVEEIADAVADHGDQLLELVVLEELLPAPGAGVATAPAPGRDGDPRSATSTSETKIVDRRSSGGPTTISRSTSTPRRSSFDPSEGHLRRTTTQQDLRIRAADKTFLPLDFFQEFDAGSPDAAAHFFIVEEGPANFAAFDASLFRTPPGATGGGAPKLPSEKSLRGYFFHHRERVFGDVGYLCAVLEKGWFGAAGLSLDDRRMLHDTVMGDEFVRGLLGGDVVVGLVDDQQLTAQLPELERFLVEDGWAERFLSVSVESNIAGIKHYVHSWPWISVVNFLDDDRGRHERRPVGAFASGATSSPLAPAFEEQSPVLYEYELHEEQFVLLRFLLHWTATCVAMWEPPPPAGTTRPPGMAEEEEKAFRHTVDYFFLALDPHHTGGGCRAFLGCRVYREYLEAWTKQDSCSPWRARVLSTMTRFMEVQHQSRLSKDNYDD